jgi:diguanylate cyclase
MSIHILPASQITAPDEVRRVVRCSWGLRVLGLALGGIMIGVVLYRHAAPASVWVLLGLHALAWPHIVRLVLRRSTDPLIDDHRLFLGDAAMGGVWIALMQFSLLPSALLATIFAITFVAIDGSRLLVRGLGLLLLACGVAGAANGFAFAPWTDTPEMLASLPLLMIFPVTLGFVTHGLAMRVGSQNSQLVKMSSIDSLSGLLNRKHWEDAVDATLARRGCDDAVMLLIDIDRFKRVNDQHGHTAGDEVVRKVGAIIRASLREGDLAGRYGGDEFAVVLCGVDMHAAATVAERIRSGVACSLFEGVPGVRCTLSIGLAGCSTATRAASDWVKDADVALYRAKLAGRNRLVLAT